MRGVTPLLVPFRRYLYPLARGRYDLAEPMLNHGSNRREELAWRRRFESVPEDFDLPAEWERAMVEREKHRAPEPEIPG